MGQRTGRYNTFHFDDHSLCFGGTYNNRKLAFATHFTQYQGCLLYTSKKSELGLKRGEDIVKLNENEYVYKSRAINIFFGIRDKQMYATDVYKRQATPMGNCRSEIRFRTIRQPSLGYLVARHGPLGSREPSADEYP